jgi:hypothetical protein
MFWTDLSQLTGAAPLTEAGIAVQHPMEIRSGR